MFLAVELGEAVNQAIENGIDILSGGRLDLSKLDVAGFTLIAQILATIILLLVVRFKFWDKVTAILEKRKSLVTASLEEKKNAENEASRMREEANQTIENAKLEAKNIITQAKEISTVEATKIMENAKMEIEQEKVKANLELERNIDEIQNNMKTEIVEVAYLLADKMISGQMNEKKNQELIDEFLKNEGNIHG